MRILAILIFGFMLGRAAAAEPDILVQAVGFAVTGSDGAKVIVVDRKQCVFKIEDYTYYLNNIYTDRISFQNMKNNMGDLWTNVEVHGRNNVVSWYTEGVTFKGTQEDIALRETKPEIFKPSTPSYPDHSFKVYTREPERLVKAWQHIYANGCKGQKSPF